MTVEDLTDRVTTASAAGAAGIHWWLPTVADVSPLLAFVAQILGVLWLACRLYQWFRDEVFGRAKTPTPFKGRTSSP
jgi:hypothetical protein